jgi:protein involved in polysaccharide export with SLBB domain
MLVARKDAYVIARGDLLDIRVYNQETLSIHGRVGPDGNVALPLAGEIEARGKRLPTWPKRSRPG